MRFALGAVLRREQTNRKTKKSGMICSLIGSNIMMIWYIFSTKIASIKSVRTCWMIVLSDNGLMNLTGVTVFRKNSDLVDRIRFKEAGNNTRYIQPGLTSETHWLLIGFRTPWLQFETFTNQTGHSVIKTIYKLIEITRYQTSLNIHCPGPECFQTRSRGWVLSFSRCSWWLIRDHMHAWRMSFHAHGDHIHDKRMDW